MFNLNEEEELTHYGQSLAEMEKFNDLMDSDSEPDEKGLLSGKCFIIKCYCKLSKNVLRVSSTNLVMVIPAEIFTPLEYILKFACSFCKSCVFPLENRLDTVFEISLGH